MSICRGISNVKIMENMFFVAFRRRGNIKRQNSEETNGKPQETITY